LFDLSKKLHGRRCRQTTMSKQRLRGEPSDGRRRTRVAIIGTGLAGLSTAYLLHHDKEERYEVTLFEQVRIQKLFPCDMTSSSCD
jgi:NADPH-dependent glutamate synthase beta subunit-like oxidoreductase